MGDKDYYKTLGVVRDASCEEIKRAYRKLVKQFHPDTNSDPAAAGRFCEIDEAHGVLVDPDARREYDRRTAPKQEMPVGDDRPPQNSETVRGIPPGELAASQFRPAVQSGGQAVPGWRKRGRWRRRREKVKLILGMVLLTICGTAAFLFLPCYVMPIGVMLAVALFIPRLRD